MIHRCLIGLSHFAEFAEIPSTRPSRTHSTVREGTQVITKKSAKLANRLNFQLGWKLKPVSATALMFLAMICCMLCNQAHAQERSEREKKEIATLEQEHSQRLVANLRMMTAEATIGQTLKNCRQIQQASATQFNEALEEMADQGNGIACARIAKFYGAKFGGKNHAKAAHYYLQASRNTADESKIPKLREMHQLHKFLSFGSLDEFMEQEGMEEDQNE